MCVQTQILGKPVVPDVSCIAATASPDGTAAGRSTSPLWSSSAGVSTRRPAPARAAAAGSCRSGATTTTGGPVVSTT